MDINGATAVVTGGGSGLGAATACQLAACGTKVAARQISRPTLVQIKS